MAVLLRGIGFLCMLGAALASPATQSTTTGAAEPAQPTICGDIINSVNNNKFYFDAVEAYNCLTSVPFNSAVALRFIDYFNTTMQFQSTLTYLRDPPEGYQQPPVDVEQVLQQISANITAGSYTNEYEFEADIMALVTSMHDTHATLYAGAMSAFSFASGIELITASVDGVQPPKVYLLDDVYYRLQHDGFNIQAISTIDGLDAVEFLTQFAALNSRGTVDPHASWNQLMYSPWLYILQRSSVFSEGSIYYPGNTLNITFDDGLYINDTWKSVYTVPYFTGPLTTAGDFYNFFVLGNYPINYYEVPLPLVFNLSTGDYESPQPLLDWYNFTLGAYPDDPITVQNNLQQGTFGGIVTGYILEDVSTGVLSIPSFDETDNDLAAFTDAVIEFINQTAQRNVSNVLIDLQGNTGGLALLAYSTFAAFFPNIEPFGGSRRRSHELANVLGNATTNYWAGLPRTKDDKVTFDGNEWMVMDLINAKTGQNFSSWDQYYGPLHENGDYFSLVEQYDFTNIVSQEAIFNDWSIPNYLTGPNKNASPPFMASRVAILTDGQCASTCSLFLEMMTYQGGVRTIAVGGEPKVGPMQAAGGTRGARAYSSAQLDQDIATANSLTDDTTMPSLPTLNPETGLRDPGLWVDYLGLNLRDQVRGNGSGHVIPLQFQYLPADCRIYYTLDTVVNASALWRYATRAMWSDSSLCVPGSMGNETAGPRAPARGASNPGFPSSWQTGGVALGRANVLSETNSYGGLKDGMPMRAAGGVHTCDRGETCRKGYWCRQASYRCKRGDKPMTRMICMPSCESSDKLCSINGLACDLSHPVHAEYRSITGRSISGGLQRRSFPPHTLTQSFTRTFGLCKPIWGSAFEHLDCIYSAAVAEAVLQPFSS